MALTPEDLSRLTKQGRSARLDWLPDSASPETLAALIAAMANGSGGTVLLGVSGPGGALVGVRDPLAAEDKMLQAVLQVEPRLVIPVPRTVRVADRAFVTLEVPSGLPHVYAVDGRYLVRSGTENVPLGPREIRRLFIERGEITFETEVAPGASLDDLDWEAAQAYAAGLGALGRDGAEAALLQRGCLTLTPGGGPRPTHAGLLLFGRDPQRSLRGAYLLAASYSGVEMTDQFQKQEITGNLPTVLRRIETFLEERLCRDVTLGGAMARAEQYELPMEAARELVVNAVAHRDYSIQGDSIRVYLFRDRLEVHSPGGLPGPMTLANLKDERFSRNPALVQVLSDLGFIERLGYGVDRILAVMRERSLREPEFVETGGGFRAILYKEQPPNPAVAPVVAGTFRDQPVNPRQEAALQFLLAGHHRITNSDLAALYPDVHVETIRRDLADLVSKGILRKLGEKRGSYYMLRAD